VSVFEPRTVEPVPDIDFKDVPEVVELISNIPLFAKLLLFEMLPRFTRFIAEPLLIVVAPVKVFVPVIC